MKRISTNHNSQKGSRKSNYNKFISLIALIIVLSIALFSGLNENSTSSSYDNSAYEVSITSSFRNEELLNEHYTKHGIAMGFSSASAYEEAANLVINNENSLHKLEAEDGDDVYYLESTNEIVIVSTDGYIRTYFKPNDGKAYYDRQ